MDTKPFWQSVPFVGGLALVAVVAVFALAGLFLPSVNLNPTPGSDAPQAPQTAVIGAELAYFEGQVEYRRGGESTGWLPAESGMDLGEGDAIRTFDNGRAIVNLDDGSAVRLNFDSELALSSLNPEDMQITNVAGEIYARVARLNRDFAVVTEEINYISLGTAYTTINKEEEKGVKVFHSKVQVQDKQSGDEVIVDEGKSFFKQDGEVKDLTLKEIKQDEFALWNKQQDEQKDEYKQDLGKLSDLTAPELKITAPTNNKQVSNNKITVNGTTEPGATVYVKGNKIANNDGSFSQQVSLREGLNKINVKAVDAAGNTIVKTVNVTYEAPVSNTNTNTGGTSGSSTGTGSIVITKIVKLADGVKVYWDVNGLNTDKGFKIVRSLDANPTYPADSPIYTGEDANARSWFISVKDGKTYHFRVCRYIDGGGCDNYSNDVVQTAPLVVNSQQVNSINLMVSGTTLKWTTDTGGNGIGPGFKITYSATGTPADYSGDNGVGYVADGFSITAPKGAGNYKECAWDGALGCTAVSNVVKVN